MVVPVVVLPVGVSSCRGGVDPAEGVSGRPERRSVAVPGPDRAGAEGLRSVREEEEQGTRQTVSLAWTVVAG